MGYAGNSEPSYIFPTIIATKDSPDGTVGEGVEDLDCYVGDQAVENSKSYATAWPIRHGLIENFTHMEKFWQQSIFKYLRAEPEDHYVLLVRFKNFEKQNFGLDQNSKIFIPLGW